MRVADYLEMAAHRTPDAEALVCGDVRMNYAQALRQVHAVAHALAADTALGERAAVAIYSGNSHWVPLLQLGANRADRIWLGVHVRNSVETNAEVLAYMDCEAVFFSAAYQEAVARLKPLLPAVRRWICIDGASPYGESLQDWLRPHLDRPYPWLPDDPEAITCMLPTGGTTGPSKGAAHSHRSMEMQLVNLVRSFGFEEGTRLLSVAPLSHAAGQFALGLLPCGGTNVIMGDFDAETLLRTVERERITHLFLPPTIVYSLLLHPLLREVDLSSIRGLVVGAAPIAPEKFKEAVRAFGPVVYEAYAQTETLIPVLVKRPADYLRPDGSFDEERLKTSGRAPTFVTVRIMDDEGRLVAPGTPGEIVMRSAMGMSHYHKRPDATAEAQQFGWHHTGDVGVMDHEGYVTLVDRKKDMIITGAFNVYPAEVEKVLNTHAAVLDCIVIGVPDEKWGEAVKAIVQLKPGAQASESEMIALCKERLGGVKAPKTVEFWPELPRSAVGKLLRREARKKFWDGHWRSI